MSAGISRVNGSVTTPVGFYGGAPAVVKVHVTNVGTADTGGSGSAIVEGNFTKAIRAIQTVASIVFIGTRGDDGFCVIVDSNTAQPTGPAYDTDASPTLAERLTTVINTATSLSCTVVVGNSSGSGSVLAVASNGTVTLTA
jgi:hypothetical protein